MKKGQGRKGKDERKRKKRGVYSFVQHNYDGHKILHITMKATSISDRHCLYLLGLKVLQELECQVCWPKFNLVP